MAATAAAAAGKLGSQIMAGQKLGKFFDVISGTTGRLASQATQAGLGKVTDTFFKGVAQENLPKVLRSSAQSMLPKYADAAAQLGTYALGSYGLDRGLDRVFDQQSAHSQPMSGGTGNRGMDQFLMTQQLQNQKFMNDMMLIQARAEARTPGSQFGSAMLDLAKAEKELTDAGEITNREVQGIGRMIYGTGLRA